MDVKGAAILYTLAGLMVTFAGFSALLLGVRQAAGARLSRLDQYLARTVMTRIFVLTAAALLPPLLGLYDLPEAWVWRVSAVLFAAPMLALQLTYPYRRRKVTGQAPPASILAVLVVLGAAATAAMLGYILAGFPHAAAAYTSAVTVDFFTVAYAFMVALQVILQQPIAPSDGSAPQ